jgi:hypothetical protein
MVKYENLIKYLVEVAERHPNINYVKFDTGTKMLNDSEFITPAFVINPSSIFMTENNGMVQYSFDIVYIDKLTQETDNDIHILEDAVMLLLGYVSVIDLEYKIIKPFTIEPIVSGQDDSTSMGASCTIIIEDCFDIEKYKSLFYETD